MLCADTAASNLPVRNGIHFVGKQKNAGSAQPNLHFSAFQEVIGLGPGRDLAIGEEGVSYNLRSLPPCYIIVRSEVWSVSIVARFPLPTTGVP